MVVPYTITTPLIIIIISSSSSSLLGGEGCDSQTCFWSKAKFEIWLSNTTDKFGIPLFCASWDLKFVVFEPNSKFSLSADTNNFDSGSAKPYSLALSLPRHPLVALLALGFPVHSATLFTGWPQVFLLTNHQAALRRWSAPFTGWPHAQSRWHVNTAVLAQYALQVSNAEYYAGLKDINNGNVQ